MKYFFIFCFFFLLCYNLAEAQTPTFAEPPGPEHVLVVYKEPVDDNDTLGLVSEAVKEYYQNARQIPNSNIVPLENLINDDIFDPVSNTTHRIILDQQGEIIRDSINQNSSTPTIHAWIYFNEKIAKPIANHLTTTYVNGTPLKDIIRFIVLVKGVPFRIDARHEDADSRGTNVICANLLTLLGETMEDPDALLFYYNKDIRVPNPYYHADQTFTMAHNFLSNHYQTNVNIGWQTKNISLSYLVTHLSAPRFSDIKGMIDRSLNAINETKYDWFIDADPTPCRGWNPIGKTELIFQFLGITNYFFDNTEDVYTNYDANKVMSYSSNGTWTSIGPGCTTMAFNSNYIQTQLNFNYADGAFFSRIESHNGLSIGTYPVVRTRGQGLLADFTLMGGTVGVGQAFHSPGSHVIANADFMPHYAVGYTFIEAAYLGMLYLNATNVIVGDPLTIIYDSTPIELPDGYIFVSGNYYDRYYVPQGRTIYVANDATVNFLRTANLNVDGNIVFGENSITNFKKFSSLKVKEASLQSDFQLNFLDNSSLFVENNLSLSSNLIVEFKNKSSLTDLTPKKYALS